MLWSPLCRRALVFVNIFGPFDLVKLTEIRKHEAIYVLYLIFWTMFGTWRSVVTTNNSPSGEFSSCARREMHLMARVCRVSKFAYERRFVIIKRQYHPFWQIIHRCLFGSIYYLFVERGICWWSVTSYRITRSVSPSALHAFRVIALAHIPISSVLNGYCHRHFLC